MDALKFTSLHEEHLSLKGNMVDFSGWSLPIHYGSVIEEHHAVRQKSGMFDVSHMTVVDFKGAGVQGFLRYLLANDVARFKQTGKALYTAMLNEEGGVIDDLIVYYLDTDYYRLILNAATRAQDLAWIEKQLPSDVTMNMRDDLSIIAHQGPEAADVLSSYLNLDVLKEMRPFSIYHHEDMDISTTGYTGEKGFEIVLPHAKAVELWKGLIAAGVKACGLGSRDTLRLESGLNLYGHEMDLNTSPIAANMGWTIVWNERDFIGRQALEAYNENPKEKLVGFVLKERGIPRENLTVHGFSADGSPVQGVTTSGTFSPTLQKGIALARVPVDFAGPFFIQIRKKEVAAEMVQPSFVRFGKPLIEL